MPVLGKRGRYVSERAVVRAVRRRGVFRRRRRGVTFRRGRGSARLARRVAFSIAESKERVVKYNFGVAGPALPPPQPWNMYHNTLYRIDLHNAGSSQLYATNVSQGPGSNERNGNEIWSLGFRVRGTFEFPVDRRNTIVKLWIVKWNNSQGQPTDPTQWYLPGGSGNVMLDSLDNHRFPRVKLLRTLRASSRDLQTTGNACSVYYNVWIPHKELMKFSGGAQNAPVSTRKEFISLVATAYDNPGALNTDAVVTRNEHSCTFYFKDP